jgi:hypothetical protein
MKSHLTPTLLAVVALGFTTSSLAENRTYQVNPVKLAKGYAVSGGHITTDGTLGPLAVSNILDFAFEVTGPHSYTFSLASPASVAVEIGGQLSATTEQLVLPPDLDPSREVNYLRVYVDLNDDNAYENLLSYTSGTYVLEDDVSLRTYSYAHVGARFSIPNGKLAESKWITKPSCSLVIASIPEPTSLLLALLGFNTFGLRGVGCMKSAASRAG